MKLKYLPEFAAMLVSYRDEIATEPDRFSDDVLGQIYIACRDRSNRIMREIDRCLSSDEMTAEALLAGKDPLADIVVRVLINDLFVRCVCAVLSHTDRTNQVDRVGSLAQNLHLGQMVLRHRAINRLISGSETPAEDIAYVNGVRERVERWTDMLIGQLGPEAQEAYAFDSERSADFENTYSRGTHRGPQNHVWRFILTGLRTGFNRIPDSVMVSKDDRNVVVSILAGISPQITQVTRDELGPRVGSLHL